MSKITASARGEVCQIRLAGVCTFNRSETVWAHANGSAAGKGIGAKSHDLLGSYACFKCHSAYDRSLPVDLPRPVVEVGFWEGHARSVVLLIEKGIVRVERGTVLVQE